MLHMIKKLFVELNDTIDTSVTLPIGFGVRIAGIGTIRLTDNMILRNVLYLPDFRLNLLTVNQLTENENRVET